jgi:hypothetical protein
MLPQPGHPTYPALFSHAVSLFDEIYDVMRDLDDNVRLKAVKAGIWFEISHEARGDHFYADAYAASKMARFTISP